MSEIVDDDQRVLSRYLAGDSEAGERLVRRFSDLVYKTIQYTLYAKQVRFHSQDVEDFHSMVFLKLFDHGAKKLRQFQGKNGCSLSTWIRVVVVRLTLNHLRDHGVDALLRQKNLLSLEDLPELRASEMEPFSKLEKKKREVLMEEGMQQLRPRDRLCLKLHFEQGLTMAEVAEVMEISVQNAHVVKHRAIQRLRSYLQERKRICNRSVSPSP